jgi:hypothetical protein
VKTSALLPLTRYGSTEPQEQFHYNDANRPLACDRSLRTKYDRASAMRIAQSESMRITGFQLRQCISHRPPRRRRSYLYSSPTCAAVRCSRPEGRRLTNSVRSPRAHRGSTSYERRVERSARPVNNGPATLSPTFITAAETSVFMACGETDYRTSCARPAPACGALAHVLEPLCTITRKGSRQGRATVQKIRPRPGR